MFVKLTRSSASHTRMGYYTTRILSEILRGMSKTFSQLTGRLPDAITYLSDVRFDLGSYPEPSYWTLVTENMSNASVGNIILSKQSVSCPSKVCYLGLYYVDGTSYIKSGTNSSLINTVDAPLILDDTTTTNYTANKTIYLRFTDNFVQFFSNGITNFSNITAVDFNPNVFDTNSDEGALKLLYLDQYNFKLLVSNMYLPKINSYISNTSVSSNININRVVKSNCAENLIDSKGTLIPIKFSSMIDGWIGGSISENIGFYLYNNDLVPGQFVKEGDDTYLLNGVVGRSAIFASKL